MTIRSFIRSCKKIKTRIQTSPVDNSLPPHVVMGTKRRPFSVSLLDREAPLPLHRSLTTPIHMTQVHQLINTAFYPQLGPSAMVCHQKRLAEDEAVNHHLSPLPAKSKNLHPNTPAEFDSLLQVLDSEGPRKSRLSWSSSFRERRICYIFAATLTFKVFPTRLRGKESSSQGRRCRRLRFNP